MIENLSRGRAILLPVSVSPTFLGILCSQIGSLYDFPVFLKFLIPQTMFGEVYCFSSPELKAQRANSIPILYPSVRQHFQTSSIKPLGQWKSNCKCSLHGPETKVSSWDLGHIIKMVAKLIYAKTT